MASAPARTLATALLVPTPTPRILSHTIDRAWLVSPSLEEQIFTSEVIVVASLLSATARTETVPSDPGVTPTYRALQVLRFRVHEYLKGTGPQEAVVVVRSDHSYLTEAEARQTADAVVAERNTAWDDRRGVLFLHTLPPPVAPGGASGAASGSPAFRFTLSNPHVQSEWDYAVDTLSRAWLPAGEASGAGGQEGDSSSQEFITDGAQSPPPVVSLADLRAKIAENDALLTAGEGVEGYIGCLHGKIYRERLRRADPWTPTQREETIASGSATGTEVYRGTRNERHPGYHNYWLSGPDMDLFRALIVDDDSQSNNGYDHTLVTARPLPAGEHSVFYNWQHYYQIPCNHVPTDAYNDWTVTVTAPEGAVHEAFFDPADLTPGAGFSASSGVLEPAGFSIGGTAASITGLKWQSGSAVLTLAPYASLTGHTLDFIALDGSVDPSLPVSSATADSAAGTLTWAVPVQPWQDGDQLMLRIRRGGAAANTYG